MAKVKQVISPTQKTVADFFSASGPEADRSGVKKWNRLTAAQRAEISLQGVDLRGRDLTGLNLNDVIAEGASFAGAQLAGARLAGKFKGASFEAAQLVGAKLAGGGFDEADFPRRISAAPISEARTFAGPRLPAPTSLVRT